MTSSDGKKFIFWFEDQSPAIEAYVKELRENYKVIVSADAARIEEKRDELIDLIIIDIMIHPNGIDHETREKAKNIHFEGVHWKDTGLEFLRHIREGDYENWGIGRNIPVIVHTAVIDYQIEEQVMNLLGASAFLKKPCSLNDLEDAIKNAMEASLK